MRILSVTVAALIASLIIFLTVKFWGLSLSYIEYKHAFFQNEQIPVHFVMPTFNETLTDKTDILKQHISEYIKNPINKYLYLNIAITQDQKVVLIGDHDSNKYKIHQKNFADLQNLAILATEYKDVYKDKKIIFNITENAMAGHEIFIDFIKAMQIDKTDNILITSPYDVMVSAIKELSPTQVYGSSQPEILKIKAMESLYLIEAATFRADVVIHPLLNYKQPFFTETVLSELKRRFKKIIVGPVTSTDEIKQAEELHPFGIIETKIIE